MKISFFLFSLVLGLQLSLTAQQLPVPAKGKSLILFQRPPVTGFAVQFKLYDSANYLGILSAGGHLNYECEPGKKIFWATAENRDFLEADLAPDQVYLAVVQVVPGFVSGRVMFVPYDPARKRADKFLKNFAKRINKGTEKKIGTTLVDPTPEQTQSSIENGLERYQHLKEKGKKITQITREMHT